MVFGAIILQLRSGQAPEPLLRYRRGGLMQSSKIKKGNIWTTGEVNPQVWALSRYDAKSLYDKMPAVTEIKSGGRMDFLGILEANDGSIWFGSGGGVHRYDGKTFTDFKKKEGEIICIGDFKIIWQLFISALTKNISGNQRRNSI